MPATTAEMAPPALGRYHLLERLGDGGMARVFRAWDPLTGRDVAVKVFGSSDAERFQAELAALARLRHPGLVAMLDSGVVGNGVATPYLVLELVTGPSLTDVLAAGPVPRALVASIGRQVADALAAVHAQQVVHRDVKPANILLVERPGTEPVAKLADFGIARLADAPRLTTTGTTVGTATYLSPEQAAGTGVGPATDVYALGLVLLECLTGRPAFTGTVEEVIAARLRREPEVPTALGPWHPLLSAMTRRDPSERPDATSVTATLDRLGGELGRPGALPTMPIAIGLGDTLRIAGRVPRPRRGRRWVWALAAATVLAAGGLSQAAFDSSPADAPAERPADDPGGQPADAPGEQPADQQPAPGTPEGLDDALSELVESVQP